MGKNKKKGMKKAVIAVFFGVVLGCMMSCEENTKKTISEDAVIKSFYLINKHTTEAKSYVFTIDEDAKEIYNTDSMSYGMPTDSFAIVMTPTFKSAELDGESIYGKDTVWVDFAGERVLTVTAKDGKTKQSYKIRVNIHNVDPDSFIWRQMDMELVEIEESKALMTEEGIVVLGRASGNILAAQSEDGEAWNDLEVSGLDEAGDDLDIKHAVVHNGEICMMSGMDLYMSDQGTQWYKETTTSSVGFEHLLFSLRGDLYALGEGSKILKLNGNEWEVTAELEAGFPVIGEAVCVGNSPSGLPRALVMGGIDADGNYLSNVWSTEDGSYWVKLNLRDSVFTPRANAAIVDYAKGILMVGGEDADSIVETSYLYSLDCGMNWYRVDSMFHVDTACVKQELYTKRHSASVVADEKGRVYIIGGQNKEGVLRDVWRGVNWGSIPGFKR